MSLPLTPRENDEIFERLSDPEIAQRAIDALSDYTRAKIREAKEIRPLILQFFAYETIGAAIPDCQPMARTDDPELMAAPQKAIEDGRVEMDGNNIVAIDGVRFNPEDADASPD